MLKQIFKQIWNDRKRFSGIFVEQTLVFIILMISMVSIIGAVKKYNEPGLLDTDNTVYFGYMATNFGSSDLPKVSSSMDEIVDKLRKNPNVKAITEGYNFAPYLRADEYNDSDSITINKVKLKIYVKQSDRYGAVVFLPKFTEGGWITDKRLSDGSEPVVITQSIADTMKWGKSVGKKLTYKNQNFTVVGVIEGMKQNVFTPSVNAIIIPIYNRLSNGYRELSAKVNDQKLFITDYYKLWNKLVVSKDVQISIADLQSAKNTSMLGTTSTIIMQAIPTLFLLIFAFIGTFGIFWLNSQKRIKEFALRIAMGSTPRMLTILVITESLIISLLSILPGLVLAFFIYEFTVTNLVAIVITIGLMMIFSVFSAWYPAYMVSKINPAKAFNYE